MAKVKLIAKLINNKTLYSTKTFNNVRESVEKYSSVFGPAAGEYLANQINHINPQRNRLSIVQKNTTIDCLNAILYPINGLPIDLAESLLLKTKKIAPKAKIIDNILNSKIIKNRQIAKTKAAKNSAISNCLDSMNNSEYEIFIQGQNRLNPIISNYGSDKERGINRLSSGLVPAIFFANDAYNQSMMINNNKKEAKIEKKKRLNQEITRIGIMAYTQFVVLGALAKYVNKSAALSIATTTSIVAGTEMLSRVFAGKKVTFMKTNKKNIEEEHPLIDIANDDSSIKHTNKFLKYTAAFFAAGAAIFALQSTKNGKKIFSHITKKYDQLINKEIHLTKPEFKNLMNKLKDNGFDKMALRYEEIAQKQTTEKIYLGKESRKYLNPIIDSIIMTPIKMAYNLATAPFKFLSKKTIIPKKGINELEGLKYINSIKNEKDFKEKLNKKILSSFDNKTKTNYSNHNLAKYTKITTSAASTYFITADSYNMVIEKGGKKENAKKVSKKVLLQRTVNIGLGAYILTALNSIFKVKYNKSLYGVAFVAGLFGLMNESISRLAVGIPITEKNREEQIKFKNSYNKLFNKNKNEKKLNKIAA